MQLRKYNRRRRRLQLNTATLNAYVQIGAFCDEGWPAYGRLSVAFGEVMLNGGNPEELLHYEDFLGTLRTLRREQAQCKKNQKQK